VFLGHIAVGFATKRAAPRTSLGLLMTAPMLADLVWPIFLLLGVEHVRIDPGNTPVTPLDFVSYPWSHSLLMLTLWGLALAGVYWWRTRYRAGAMWLGIGVVSHWVLDAVSHRADMPLWPGGPKVGLGLWYSMPATVMVESAMLAAGLAIYLGATRMNNVWGRVSLWSFVGLIVLAYVGALTGGPPPDSETLARFALVSWIFVPWAWWIEQTRRTTVDTGVTSD